MIKHSHKEEVITPDSLDDLRSMNAHLERRLEHHSVQLSAAHIEVDTLAQAISHDLRSPLQIIEGFAELLTKHSSQSLDEKGQHYLQRINTAAVQIGKMIDEILALSRMSRSEMHVVPVDLESLVRKVAHDYDAKKGERRVIWLIGRLPTVQADPTLLRKVISSLVSNALKFTRSREVARIQIGVKGRDGEMEFFVRDNGASFSIRNRERMFDTVPERNPASELKCGALKLAFIQRIIQRHGGHMSAETVADGGATFYFSLPGDLPEPHPRPKKA